MRRWLRPNQQTGQVVGTLSESQRTHVDAAARRGGGQNYDWHALALQKIHRLGAAAGGTSSTTVRLFLHQHVGCSASPTGRFVSIAEYHVKPFALATSSTHARRW